MNKLPPFLLITAFFLLSSCESNFPKKQPKATRRLRKPSKPKGRFLADLAVGRTKSSKPVQMRFEIEGIEKSYTLKSDSFVDEWKDRIFEDLPKEEQDELRTSFALRFNPGSEILEFWDGVRQVLWGKVKKSEVVEVQFVKPCEGSTVYVNLNGNPIRVRAIQCTIREILLGLALQDTSKKPPILDWVVKEDRGEGLFFVRYDQIVNPRANNFSISWDEEEDY